MGASSRKVMTDHKSLQYFKTQPQLSGRSRAGRMSSPISDFDIEYIDGKLIPSRRALASSGSRAHSSRAAAARPSSSCAVVNSVVHAAATSNRGCARRSRVSGRACSRPPESTVRFTSAMALYCGDRVYIGRPRAADSHPARVPRRRAATSARTRPSSRSSVASTGRAWTRPCWYVTSCDACQRNKPSQQAPMGSDEASAHPVSTVAACVDGPHH